MYTATKWSTIADKEKFEKQFKKFVFNDFQMKHFPKWFYLRLTQCFGHIAHYNQAGFYDVFFHNSLGKINFLQQCVEYPQYGDPECTFVDVEAVLRSWIQQEQFISQYRKQLANEQETRELAEFTRLKLKYEGAK